MTIVDVAHLTVFLDTIAEWYRSLQEFPPAIDADRASQVPLQIAFMDSVATMIPDYYPEDDAWHV